VVVSPAEHDRIVSMVSHVPHLLAAALMAAAPDKYLRFAAGGFRDVTRIAGGDPLMWRDVIFTNRENILRTVAQVERKLNTLKRYVRLDQRVAFTRTLLRAKMKRDAIEL